MGNLLGRCGMRRALGVAPLAVLAIAVAGWPGASSAAAVQGPTRCALDLADGRLEVTAGEGVDFNAGIERVGAEIVVRDRQTPGSPRLTCTGGTPTVRNVDRIVVDGTKAFIYTDLLIDLRGGPLAPGATIEGNRRDSEIEISYEFEGRTNEDGGVLATVSGTKRGDEITLGRRGGRAAVNLNAGRERRADADLRLVHESLPSAGAPVVEIAGGDGDDTLDASGGAGFSGPLRPRIADLSLSGGDGDDVLTGGAWDDWISGGDGDDTVGGSGGRDEINGGGGGDILDGSGGADDLNGGAGRDTVFGGGGKDDITARDGMPDRVDCGGAVDHAKLDRQDAPLARRCEKLDRLSR